jgi:hypothetical protein
MPVRMAGRKTGREAKETLQEKYMSGWIQVCGERKAWRASERERAPMRLTVPDWRMARAEATRFSAGVRKVAVEGESGRKR